MRRGGGRGQGVEGGWIWMDLDGSGVLVLTQLYQDARFDGSMSMR